MLLPRHLKMAVLGLSVCLAETAAATGSSLAPKCLSGEPGIPEGPWLRAASCRAGACVGSALAGLVSLGGSQALPAGAHSPRLHAPLSGFAPQVKVSGSAR